MRKRSKLSLLLILLCLTFKGSAQNYLVNQLGKDVLIADSFYVVHSGEGDNNINGISNIYLIKGKNDSVWIFGAGYGNRKGTLHPDDDIVYYGRTGPYRSALDDARIVDTIIHTNFGLSKSKAKLMFITPHGHLDHINMEFLSSLCDTLGYSRNALKIFIHTNDYKLATCNQPYCGDTIIDPPGPNNPYRGAPFDVPWTSTYINKFKKLGSSTDGCNKIVKTFTSVLGTCNVVKGQPVISNGHTDGTVNLDNPTHKFRIDGAGEGTDCYVNPTWLELHIHGDTPDTLPFRGSSLCFSYAPFLIIFPNPAHDQISIELSKDSEDGLISVYNSLGIRISSFALFAGSNQSISCGQWPRGLYSIVFSNAGTPKAEKLILVQ